MPKQRLSLARSDYQTVARASYWANWAFNPRNWMSSKRGIFHIHITPVNKGPNTAGRALARLTGLH